MMQFGVRNETHCLSDTLFYIWFSELCLHSARHQGSVGGDQAAPGGRGGG